MRCPFCGRGESRVIDSREVDEGVRRRRRCLDCDNRFNTYERLQSRGLFVIKKDGRREEFNRDKLLSGIRKACEKRPLPIGTVDKLVDDIEAGLYNMGRLEVPGSVIGDMVMAALKKLDYIAYIRFASVYRDFTDITALKRELDTLLAVEPENSPLPGQLALIPAKPVTGATRRQRRRS